MRPFLRSVVGGLLLGILTLAPAMAAKTESGFPPMRFWTEKAPDGRTLIFAEGQIMADTADRFARFLARHDVLSGSTVVLDSPGGAVDAGMNLGRLFRKNALSTAVGLAPDKAPEVIRTIYASSRGKYGYFPGACESACSLAFLGGLERLVIRGSLYGVHEFRFSRCQDAPASGEDAGAGKGNRQTKCIDFKQAVAVTQIISAQHVAYLQEMGIDPALIAEMVKALPQDMNFLDEEKMRRYGVVTTGRKAAPASQWPRAYPHLYALVTDDTGSHRLIARAKAAPGPVLGYAAGFSAIINAFCPFLKDDWSKDVARILANAPGDIPRATVDAGRAAGSMLLTGKGECFNYDVIVAQGTLRDLWSSPVYR